MMKTSKTKPRWRAISLGALEASLSEGKVRHVRKELRDIGAVRGYLSDPESDDLILLALHDGGPSVELDDIVVVLRNVFLRYARRHGLSILYEPPGCSIDPQPRVRQQLRSIGAELREAGHARQELLRRWCRTCKAPQMVRVLGMPFDCGAAHTVVLADYNMKSLVDGTDDISVDGFRSLTDLRIDEVRRAFATDTSPRSGSTTNRFEFVPGQTEYRESKGVTLIDRCPVTLITEEEFVARNGNSQGMGRPNPLAQEVGSAFTSCFAEIAARREIYARLHLLFQLVAVMTRLHETEAHREEHLSHLLDVYPLRHVRTKRQLPGRPHVAEWAGPPSPTSTEHWWFQSCGGVTIDVNRSSPTRQRDHALTRFRAETLLTRPRNHITWPLDPSATRWLHAT